MRDVEYREQLRKTTQLIDSDPTEVVLRRKQESQRTAAGGPARSGTYEDQPPVRVFFGAKMRDGLALQDSQGDRIVLYYTLVTEPGADVKKGDKFTLYGTEYTVTYVHRNLPYELKADVEAYGGR